MARRRAFAPGAAAISSRRLTDWFQFQPTQFTMTAAGGTVVFSLNAAALALRPFTVVRSHFIIMVRSDQSTNPEVQVGAYGIVVVSDEAVAAGVNSVPIPFANAASDLWFLHEFYLGNSSDVTDKTIPAVVQRTDSKAMRKVHTG